MTIINQTPVNLYVRGTYIPPNKSIEIRELIFDSLDIHSAIGSCEVHTNEAENRDIKNFGKLIVKENEDNKNTLFVTAIE